MATREALDRWAARLDQLGIAHGGVAEPDHTANRMLTSRDPDNIQLEFFWPAPPTDKFISDEQAHLPVFSALVRRAERPVVGSVLRRQVEAERAERGLCGLLVLLPVPAGQTEPAQHSAVGCDRVAAAHRDQPGEVGQLRGVGLLDSARPREQSGATRVWQSLPQLGGAPWGQPTPDRVRMDAAAIPGMETGGWERRKAQTKVAMAGAAVRLFREFGYEKTPVEDIARAAHSSPRTFFRYFGTKEDVLFLNIREIQDDSPISSANPSPD